MNELFDAIFDKYVADGKYGLTALYNTEAKGGAVFPYGVFSLINAATELADFTEDWENCLIQFNLFDDNSLCTNISTAYKALKNALHKFDLVIVDADVISLRKEVANLIRVEGVWRYNISFRIEMNVD